MSGSWVPIDNGLSSFIDPPPPVQASYEGGHFVIEEDYFFFFTLFFRSFISVKNFNLMKETCHLPERVFPFAKAP